MEVLDQVKRENTVVCLHSNTSKNFLLITVIREYSYGIQRNFDQGGQRIICLTMGITREKKPSVIYLHTFGSFA